MRKANITMRTTEKEKHYLQAAAEIAGYSNLTNFIMTTARREANRILSDINTTYVSARDWHTITDLLENPPEPNQALIDLLSREDKGK